MSKLTCKNLKGFQNEISSLKFGDKILSDYIMPGQTQKHFNPTDILAASLASCTMTMMEYMASKRSVNFTGSELEIEKFFDNAKNAVTKFIMTVKFAPSVDKETQKICLTAAETCPVHKALAKDIVIEIKTA